MKKLLALVLMAGFFTAGSMAKDGPFPIYLSVGVWKSSNNLMEIKISIVKFIDRNTAVIKVIARTLPEKEIFASGVSIFKLSSTKFIILLRSAEGNRTKLTLTPGYDQLTKRFELNMDLIELDSLGSQSVPTKLIKE